VKWAATQPRRLARRGRREKEPEGSDGEERFVVPEAKQLDEKSTKELRNVQEIEERVAKKNWHVEQNRECVNAKRESVGQEAEPERPAGVPT